MNRRMVVVRGVIVDVRTERELLEVRRAQLARLEAIADGRIPLVEAYRYEGALVVLITALERPPASEAAELDPWEGDADACKQ